MEIKIPYGKTFQTLNIEEGFELLESKIQELEAGADGGAIVRAAMDLPGRLAEAPRARDGEEKRPCSS